MLTLQQLTQMAKQRNQGQMADEAAAAGAPAPPMLSSTPTPAPNTATGKGQQLVDQKVSAAFPSSTQAANNLLSKIGLSPNQAATPSSTGSALSPGAASPNGTAGISSMMSPPPVVPVSAAPLADVGAPAAGAQIAGSAPAIASTMPAAADAISGTAATGAAAGAGGAAATGAAGSSGALGTFLQALMAAM